LISASTVRAQSPDLYQETVPVRDRNDESRAQAFREGLDTVIVRVTGDAGLSKSAQVTPITDIAQSFVTSHAYIDKGGAQALALQFDPEKVNLAIEAHGLTVWRGQRPRTAVFIGVKEGDANTVLTGDGDANGRREELLQAAASMGLPLNFPKPGTVDYQAIAKGDIEALAPAGKELGDAMLIGALKYDGDIYWTVSWTLVWFGQDLKTWEAAGFQDTVALRQAVQVTAKFYSSLAVGNFSR
jgi:hypothetical protein